MTLPVRLVEGADALRRATERLGEAPRLALDVESNGLFRYRATLCTLQLASTEEVVVVDALGADLTPLAPLLGPGGPPKILHDLAFDARILGEAGIVLGNVIDTSVTARMLGRQATGLASLLKESGIELDKKLQHHDWTERPLREMELRYLADDVVHLFGLADRLTAEVEAAGIGAEIDEEVRYRLAQALAAVDEVDPRPPWVRLKGVDRVPRAEWPILRKLAALREERARALDVPPYKVVGPDILFAIARARPRTLADLERIRGATSGRARALAGAMLAAVDATELPEDEVAALEKPRPPAARIKARRARETRLTSWRKATAKARGVDEQVVLPGHCLQDLADLETPGPAELAAVPGLGAFRIARDGAALLAALGGPEGA